jgi:catechol 2,3-dioxygenase-like lactoylglutathione lyase family enzyme
MPYGSTKTRAFYIAERQSRAAAAGASVDISTPVREAVGLPPLSGPWHGSFVGRPFVLHELDHVVLRCADPGRMERFYVDVLGLGVERRLDAIGLVQLRCGRSLIDLVPGGRGAESVPNMDHFCLGIDAADVGRVQAYLQERGVEIAGGPARVYGARGTGTSLYVRDPEHNTIELKLVREGGDG